MIASNPILLIVVGAGLIGPRHAQHIVQNPDCDLLALIDPRPEAVELAKNLETLYFKSIEVLFQYLDENSIPYPDGALICTPNHTHASISAKLASRGIHLLIEKPVSTSLEEARALQQFAKEKNVKVLIGHHRRFNPFIVSAKENLHKIGDVIAFQGAWTLQKPQSYFEASPWRTDVRTGGGALLINLVHDLDLLQFLFGPIERVYAELLKKQRNQYPNVDEGACLTIKFKNGVTGTFICADNVTSPFNFEVGTGENPLIPFDDKVEGVYKIFGSDGTLSIPDFTLYHQSSLTAEKRSWNENVEREYLLKDRLEIRKTKPFDSQLNHFVEVIRGKADPICPIDDGIRALLCIDAVIKSLESELPQYVEAVDDITPDFQAIGVDCVMKVWN